MDKATRAKLRNASFEAMMAAHDLKYSTDNRAERQICEAVYEAHFALYQLLVERELKEGERIPRCAQNDNVCRMTGGAAEELPCEGWRAACEDCGLCGHD